MNTLKSPRGLNINNNAKALRELSGLTLREVAKCIGVKHSNLSTYERTGIGIGMPHRRNLAVFYNVSLDVLEGDEPAPIPNKKKRK